MSDPGASFTINRTFLKIPHDRFGVQSPSIGKLRKYMDKIIRALGD